MPLLVADCPRCHAKKHTFDVLANVYFFDDACSKHAHEAFCCCRACGRTTIFVLHHKSTANHEFFKESIMQYDRSLNAYCIVKRFINISDTSAASPPKYLPDEVETAFVEAARAHAIGCWNAAGCMFRACVDMATKSLLPEDTDGPDKHTRRTLALRLKWLFENELLPAGFRDLATCIREDGNDAAHMAALGKEDSSDLLDFTFALLERIYTEPSKLQTAIERRNTRRQES